MNRRFFQVLEVVTVGLPFCAFKILTGIVFVARPWLSPFGWILIALGCLDGIVNAINLASLITGRARVFGVCLTQILVRRWRPNRVEWDDLGISIDVMLSFILVAVMIGFNLLPALPPAGLTAWSFGVVLNVLGAGFGRLSSSLGSLGEAPRRQ